MESPVPSGSRRGLFFSLVRALPRSADKSNPPASVSHVVMLTQVAILSTNCRGIISNGRSHAPHVRWEGFFCGTISNGGKGRRDNLGRPFYFILLVAILQVWLWAPCPMAFCQAPTPPEVLPSDQNSREHRGLAILRISEQLLDRLLAKDIDKHSEVDRCVLGTRALGTAHTAGQADVDPKPNKDDASFQITVTGESRSKTVGRNGPAIIHSRSVTKWEVKKNVHFDEGKFYTQPGTIESKTKLIPTGIDATVPGLRRRLVKRIAKKRLQEQRCQAERITEGKTRERVLHQVDKAIDERIDRLNARIQSRPILNRILPMLDSRAVDVYTSENCIHLAFMGNNEATAVICPLNRLEPTESELWIHASSLGLPILELPSLIELPGAADKWLNDNLSKLDLPAPIVPGPDISGLDELAPLSFQLVDGWVVMQSKPAAPTANKSVLSDRQQ